MKSNLKALKFTMSLAIASLALFALTPLKAQTPNPDEVRTTTAEKLEFKASEPTSVTVYVFLPSGTKQRIQVDIQGNEAGAEPVLKTNLEPGSSLTFTTVKAKEVRLKRVAGDASGSYSYYVRFNYSDTKSNHEWIFSSSAVQTTTINVNNQYVGATEEVRYGIWKAWELVAEYSAPAKSNTTFYDTCDEVRIARPKPSNATFTGYVHFTP
jgi:hypothetical protein